MEWNLMTFAVPACLQGLFSVPCLLFFQKHFLGEFCLWLWNHRNKQ